MTMWRSISARSLGSSGVLEVVRQDLDELAARHVLDVGAHRRRSFGEIALERGADLAARAVQQDALVAVADAQRGADLLGLPSPRRRAARCTSAWRGGSVAIASCTQRERLAAQQALLGQLAPVRRRGGPVAGPAMALAAEAVGVDRGLVVLAVAGQGGERRAAALAHARASWRGC